METVKATSDARALVRQTLRYLGRRVRVQQAILFGSHARGAADEWSDVDLAVVSSDFARMSHQQVIDLLVEVALAVDPRVEIRAYTPRDLRGARPTNFLGHVLATGKVVYKAGNYRDGGQRRRSKTRDRGRGDSRPSKRPRRRPLL